MADMDTIVNELEEGARDSMIDDFVSTRQAAMVFSVSDSYRVSADHVSPLYALAPSVFTVGKYVEGVGRTLSRDGDQDTMRTWLGTLSLQWS